MADYKIKIAFPGHKNNGTVSNLIAGAMLILHKFRRLSMSMGISSGVGFCCILPLALPTLAQSSSYQQMEQMLDAAAPAPLTQTPMNNAGPGTFNGSAQYLNGTQNIGAQNSGVQMGTQFGNGQLGNQQFQQAPLNDRPFMNQGSNFVAPASPLRRAMNFLRGSGAAGAAQPPVQQPVARPGLFKTLFGDSSGGAGTGESNMYRAQNQASIAHNAYLQSCYGDHYSRSSYADQAYYAAEEARHEADYADEKASNSTDPNARQYASSARYSAEAAQADYYRARGNADSNWK